jgi:hypothetical protein
MIVLIPAFLPQWAPACVYRIVSALITLHITALLHLSFSHFAFAFHLHRSSSHLIQHRFKNKSSAILSSLPPRLVSLVAMKHAVISKH